MIRVRSFEAADAEWAAPFLAEHEGSDRIVSRGRVHQPLDLPGFVAEIDGKPAGHAAYRIDGTECEIVWLGSLQEGRGAGSALIDAVRRAASQAGCTRLWLITTNNNTHALRFYQRRGFVLAALHRGAVDEARRTLKPEIPEADEAGIPVRDEIELEMRL